MINAIGYKIGATWASVIKGLDGKEVTGQSLEPVKDDGLGSLYTTSGWIESNGTRISGKDIVIDSSRGKVLVFEYLPKREKIVGARRGMYYP